MKRLKKITIKKKSWCRGKYRNEYGHFCALGFAGHELYGDARYYSTNNFSNDDVKIIRANDRLNGKERKEELTRLFKEAGYKLEFV